MQWNITILKCKFCISKSRYYGVFLKFTSFFETLLMVNFCQKTAIFYPWNFLQKKKNHQNHLKPPWNLVSFTKTDKLKTWNHFWFHENWLIFKSSPKINIWCLKLARFQNENGDRLHSEDALFFTKGDDIWFFCSF